MILVFDKNYFFYDEQIDRSNPVQLHLIYTKAVTSIVSGQYPTTLPEATLLAGTQCQAVYGNHDPKKHVPGFIKLADMIPAQWLTHKKFKPKQIENMVFQEWKKIPHTSDVNAKYKYVSSVRKLPTYGITFYTVKMPNPNAKRDAKNPFVPLLVGITKEKILKMNYETKQIEVEYPLVHLKRWASLRGKFTFDFGDHHDSYWTVFTDQGDAMSDLIAGYIDIILNNRKQSMRTNAAEEGGSIAYAEDHGGMATMAYASMSNMQPQRVEQPITRQQNNQPAGAPVVTYDDPNAGRFTPGQGTVDIEPRPSTATLETLEDAARMATTLRDEAMKPKVTKASERRTSSVSPTQLIEALVHYERALDSDVEILVSALGSGDFIGANKAGIDLVNRAKGFANAAEQAGKLSENGPLMQQPIVGVIGAIRELVEAGRDFQNGGDPGFLQSCKKGYDDSMLLMQSAQDGNFNDKAAAALVGGILRDIAVNVDDLNAAASTAAGGSHNQEEARLINNFVKQVKSANGALQASATTLSQAMIDPQAKNHILESAGFLKNLCDGLQRSCAATGDHAPRIENKCENVALAINRLQVALEAGDSSRFDNDVVKQLEIVKQYNPLLQDPASGQKQLLDSLKTVATAANEIVKQSLAMAPAMPPGKGPALEKHATTTKDLLTNGLTAVGKQAIRAPTNPTFRGQLDGASKETEKKCSELVDMILGSTADSAMRMAAKQMLGSQFALQAAIQEAGAQAIPFQKLFEEGRELRVNLESMLQAVAAAAKNGDREAQERLLQAFKLTVPHANKQIAALARIPMNGLNPQTQSILGAAKADAMAALQAMMQAAQRYEAADTGKANVADALRAIEANQQQIDAAIFTAQSGFLSPLDNESYEVSLENLKGFGENMNQALNNLSKVVYAGGDLSQPSKAIADCATDLISLGESLAGSLNGDSQLKFLEALRGLNNGANKFIDACKRARIQKNDRNALNEMEGCKKEAARALCEVLSAARGINTGEMAAVIDAIRNEMNNLMAVKKEGVDYPTGVKALGLRGKAIQLAGQQLVETSQRAPQRVLQQSKLLEATAKQLVAAANAAAGASNDPNIQQNLLNVSAQVIDDLANLVDHVNTAVVTGNYEPVARALDQLGASVANLQNATSGSMFPEIDQAIASINENQAALNDPNIPGQGTRQVLFNVENALSNLLDNADRLVTAASLGTDKTGIYAGEAANEINAILQAAASSANPIGGQTMSAPVKQTDVQEYLNACSEIIGDPAVTNKVGPAAMKIGRLTKDFAASARDDAIALAHDKERQKNFINASKSMSAGLPKLVAAIKSNNPPLIQKCAEFLNNACIVMDAARTGVSNDVPVPSNVSDALKMVADNAANATKALLAASSDLASDPSNNLLSDKVLEANRGVTNALNKVADVVKSLDPTMQAVKKTSGILTNAITDLELAAVNLEVGVPLQSAGKSKVDCQNELVELLQSLAPELRNFASDGNPDALCASADHLCLQIPQLVDATRGLASYSGANAKKLLAQAKNLAGAMQRLANECYTGGPNTEKYNAEACSAVGDMLGGLKASTELFAEIDALVNKVDGLVSVLNQPFAPTGKPYPKLKDEVNELIRGVMSSGVALKTCDLTSIATIGVQAKALARTIPTLLNTARDAIATTQDPTAKEKLKSSIVSLIYATTGMIRQAKEVAIEDDLGNRADFDDKWNEFTQAVSKVLSNLQRGALGESKINAGSQLITNTINKLNTSAIFVSAGQELEGVEKTNMQVPQLIMKLTGQSNNLQTIAGQVAANAPKSQEDLGVAVESFSKLVSDICDTTLQVVEKQGDTEVQQNMINAAKAAAISAKQLILSAKDVQAHPGDSTAAATLQNAVAMFPRALQTFTSVVKGEGAANTSALDAVYANILKALTSGVSNPNSNAIQIIESARNITKAATPLVLGSSQSELVKGADDALHGIQDLLANINGAQVPTPSVKVALQNNGKQVGNSLAKLVEASKGNRLDPATHDKISESSLGLTKSLEGLVTAVNQMPGGAGLTLFGAAKEQPTTTGALDEAAEAIKRALASLPIRQAPSKSLEMITNPNELNDVLVAHARAIAEATYVLVENASQAERETGTDPTTKERYHNDATWSNGLISASHKAANCVTLMIEAANAAINGNLEEEKLIANSKQVAVSVKQLVVASNVRGISTKLQIDMSESAKNVAKGTSDIVATAQRAGEFKMQAEATKQKRFGGAASGSMIQKLEQQAQILRLEKQLEEARRAMGNINNSEYKK